MRPFFWKEAVWMAYIYVDGEEFPYPERGVGIIVTTPVNSARNTKAEVVGQRIGRDQYKINNLKWPMLSADQWSFILKKFRSGFGVSVTFTDPVTGEWITLKMYPGDRSAEPFWLDGEDSPPDTETAKSIS